MEMGRKEGKGIMNEMKDLSQDECERKKKIASTLLFMWTNEVTN